jgi:hypothetical protein
MLTAVVRYIGDPPKEQTIVIHPVDEMRAKRELGGKDWVDDEYRLFYHCWLAARRTGAVTDQMSFDLWLEGVGEVEPVLSEKQIAEAQAVGSITDKQAEFMREQLARQGSGRGESLTEPS